MKKYPQNRVNIAFADDHVMVRHGLCNLINTIEPFYVTFQADDGEKLLNQLKTTCERVDICLLDINMPNRNGWSALREINRNYPNMAVLIVSTLGDDSVINWAMQSGARGFICKASTRDELKQALITVANGGNHFKFESGRPNNGVSELSRRELEFLGECCDDVSYKDIANRMNVSVRTVEGYRDSLFDKLDLKTRVGLVLYALKNGFGSFFRRDS